MTNITASTTKDFFGEPIYLGELTKDIVAAALGLDRGSLRFVHHKNDDPSSEVAIALTIDTPGNDVVADQIVQALTTSMHPSKLTFSVVFTESMPGDFETSDALKKVLTNREAGLGEMISAHLPSPDRLLEDALGEHRDQMAWLYKNLPD